MSATVCHCGHLEQTHAQPGHAGCRSPTCGCAAFESEDDPVQIPLLEWLYSLLPPPEPKQDVQAVPVPAGAEIGLEALAA